MVNKKLRKAIDNMCLEEEMTTYLFDNHSFDNSIIGITEDGKLVYSFEKMIAELMKDENCSEEDAIEWIEYNTMRSLPYFGEHAPIIIMETKKTIIDKYGG